LGIRLHSRVIFGVLVLVLTIATLLVATIAILRDQPASHRVSLSAAAIANAKRPASGVPSLPACPPGGMPVLQPSAKTGHHRVTLTWHASAPAANSDSAAVGYCLYRSKTQNAAKQNPRCSACEQINSVPIVGTGCVDHLVEDAAAYYYVVTAINAKGEISSSSNETAAPVPANQGAGSSIPDSYPLCRTTPASQPTGPVRP